jgi:hypothetical protein
LKAARAEAVGDYIYVLAEEKGRRNWPELEREGNEKDEVEINKKE